MSVALSGCSGLPWSGPSEQEQARAAVDAFVAGLLRGEAVLGPDAPDAQTASRVVATAYGSLGRTRPQITVDAVTVGDPDVTARATLTQTWRFAASPRPWTYPTELRLRRGDAGWRVDFTPEALAPGLRAGDTLTATRVTPERADILGAGGRPLVEKRRVYRLGVDRSTATPAQAAVAATRLAKAVDIDPKAYLAAVRGAGPKAFVPALVARPDSPEAKAATALHDLPGVAIVVGDLPLAPTPGFAKPLLGRVGDATAELVDKSGGAIRAGDVVGLTGLQAAHQKQLAGSPGYEVRIVGADGQSRPAVRVEPTPGTPLRTTLDEKVQTAAEATLAKVAPASAIVAVRPSTGDVVAAASGPGGQGYSTATLGQYAPGSTFKAVTVLAALRSGLTLDTPVPCTANVVVDGRSFHNYDNYPNSGLGAIPLREAFAQSCNTAMIALRDRLRPGALTGAATALGLDVDPALGVPAYLGKAVDETTSTGRAASLIGQGQVLASPLGMATAAASIGAGHVVRPRLVLGGAAPAATAPNAPLTPAEAAALRDAMGAVVTRGTGHALRGTPGGPVVAKSGTAEYGSDTPPKTHAWMIGVQGDLAVAVFVEDGAGGAATAGPLLRTFLTAAARS